MKAIVIQEIPAYAPRLKEGEEVTIIPGMETDAEGIWNAPAGKLVLCLKEDGTTEYTTPKSLQYILPKFNAEDFATGAIIVEENKWSIFRREAAKDILAGFAAKIGHPMSDYSEQSCKYAIQLADELIRQLKQEQL